MKLQFFEIGMIEEEDLSFAVISTRYKGKWVYVRHKWRNSWEIPGGHRENGENIVDTARRELLEETGALKVDLVIICDYSMNDKKLGRLFYAEILELSQLPASEIAEITLVDGLPALLTYPQIQPEIFRKTAQFLNLNR